MDSIAKLTKKFRQLLSNSSKQGWGWKTRLAKETGVTRSCVCHWFTGSRMPSAKKLSELERKGLI